MKVKRAVNSVKRRVRFKRPIKFKRPTKFKLKRRIKPKQTAAVKRPNAALYFITYALVYPALKVCFKLDVDRSDLKLPKGPHVVLANHITMLDFLLVMLSFYPRRLNAVGAQKWFLSRPLHKLLPLMGVIPKNMFDPDIRSIVGMKTVLKQGRGILLFPEGRCSSSQVYAGMHKSTGKLVKNFGVPVISCYIEGAESCIPHWRKGFRCGRIRITFRNLFSEEDIASLSIDEINAAIDARLSGDEGALPTKKPFQTARSKRLAEGLHRLLYYCPKCEQEFTMISEDDTIRCTACGNGATINRGSKLTSAPGSIIEDEISLWFKEQVQKEMQSLSEDMEPFIEKVKVRTPSSKPGGGMVESGSGVMRLDPKGWHFDGEISGEEVSLFFPIEAIPAMSYDHCDNFQIYHNGDYYMFIPEDKRKCMKYVILTECMHWKFSSRVLLTPGKNSGFMS
ncbi:MAG: 1-acyl-sn-glycerol-3-phosphate acyltransferase [Oscillospiraceae bacterium]|jgi:1-acyl-sn-glycerol-3-phosphate acyltransferase|nr:1-acyl-sn-glycerol-3-phosphate acyltransferase [Oscillospiraceae bacterium]